VHLRIRVLDGNGQPVPDSCIEAWHADASGAFLFGRVGTNVDGTCAFETVVPGQTAPDAAHVNLCVFMRGLLRHVYTRAYLVDADAASDDPVLALVPAERRETLIAQRAAGSPDTWTFDIHLQGDRETVFFDL
jgi:protocatechuate 3,4-dioxygenase alpha subunit